MTKKRIWIFTAALLLSLFLCIPSYAASAVCKIGNKNYASLQKAVNAVKKGQTIKVTKKITTSETLQIQKPKVSFTIDFSNKAYLFTAEGAEVLHVSPKSKVTLKNMNITSDGSLNVEKNATLTIVSGSYKGKTLFNNGTLNIKGGTFVMNGEFVIPDLIHNRGKLNVSGGTITGNVHCAEAGSAAISAGTFKGTKDISFLFQANNKSNVTITGGKFTTPSGTCIGIFDGSSLIIKGGTFKTSDHQPGSCALIVAENSTATVTKGKFTGPVACGGSGAKLKIKNGTINGIIEGRPGGKITLAGGKGSDCVIARAGSVITIDFFTINQPKPNPNEAALLVAFGTININGGSFTSPEGVGYGEFDGGKVNFSVVNYQRMFHVKQLKF